MTYLYFMKYIRVVAFSKLGRLNTNDDLKLGIWILFFMQYGVQLTYV